MAMIDVLLPVKNGASFLLQALHSIQRQTVTDWRMLVLDHGSTDDTLALAEDLAARDRRIVIHRFPAAQGLAGLLNQGLDLADCRYILRHDADDVAYPDRMEHLLRAFADAPESIVIGGQGDVIDSGGGTIGRLDRPVGRDRLAAASFFSNPIAHPTTMLDFAKVDQWGIRYGHDILKVLPPEQSLQVTGLAEDYLLFGQLGILGYCNNIPRKVIGYRVHGANVGCTRARQQMEVSLQISRFLMRSFCAMHDVGYVDPAPFCNHGGRLCSIAGTQAFDEAFGVMAASLRRALGNSDGVERELAYRHCLATRHRGNLFARYAAFRTRHRPTHDEWPAVRAWLVRRSGDTVDGLAADSPVPSPSTGFS
jgi:glycosyltransferase involved in cell wall biosynthesis